MLTFIFALLMATPLPAKPSRFVTDSAGVLDGARANALNEKLAEFERGTSDQILVYVDRHVPEGTTLEELGAEAIRTWGVGQKGKDNGAILFIFTDDRKMRIEVGYGLEGALTDAKSKDILGTVVKPHLKNGDYNGAVEDGVNAMLATVRGESYAGTGVTVAQQSAGASFFSRYSRVMMWILIIGVYLTYQALFGRRRRRVSADGASYNDYDSSSSSSTDWSSSSDSSSSSSSSSDFSGGGGSGGGGGASDSW